MRNLLKICATIALITGCSSTKHAGDPDEHDKKVIGRIDDLSSRPSWVKESEPFRTEDGMVIMLGKQTVGGDQSLEQAMRSAELNAKAIVAQAIEQRIQVAFQNAEEGYDVSANQARFVGMAATEVISTSSIRLSKKYWERYRLTSESGQRVTKVDAFVALQMPEPEFKKAIYDALRKREGKGSISKEFAKKVESQWDNIMGSSKPEETRNPSSTIQDTQ